METIRSVNGTGKTEAEIRYFLTSCGDDPAILVQAIHRHWSIENALHWVLERTLAWLNRNRRLTVRYERRADIHLAFHHLAASLICLNFVRRWFC